MEDLCLYLDTGELGDVSECFHNLEDKEDYVLEQFTGLTDKHGNEIYEGDIIRHEHGTPNVSVVKWISEDDSWDYTGFQIESLFNQGGQREVIGNIHENPELLVK